MRALGGRLLQPLAEHAADRGPALARAIVGGQPVPFSCAASTRPNRQTHEPIDAVLAKPGPVVSQVRAACLPPRPCYLPQAGSRVLARSEQHVLAESLHG